MKQLIFPKQELDDEVVIPPLKLRKYLAGSVLDYEGMRDSDSPPAGVSWQVLSSSSSHFQDFV